MRPFAPLLGVVMRGPAGGVATPRLGALFLGLRGVPRDARRKLAVAVEICHTGLYARAAVDRPVASCAGCRALREQRLGLASRLSKDASYLALREVSAAQFLSTIRIVNAWPLWRVGARGMFGASYGASIAGDKDPHIKHCRVPGVVSAAPVRREPIGDHDPPPSPCHDPDHRRRPKRRPTTSTQTSRGRSHRRDNRRHDRRSPQARRVAVNRQRRKADRVLENRSPS
jgi:hypothetical protein